MTGELENLLQEEADAAVRDGYVSVVVGAIFDGEMTIVGAGRSAAEKPGPQTVFRIASLSKVVTATALAVGVGRGELSLDDPAEWHLPAGFTLSTDEGQQILVRHLATHTSGLPRGLEDHVASGYSHEAFGRAISALRLTIEPGRTCVYSNLGGALLGYVVASAADLPFAELLRVRIASPLGLRDLVVELDCAQRAKLADGHDESGAPVATPTFPTGVASGGLYGTAADLLRFVRAHLGPGSPEIQRAAELATRCHYADDQTRLGLCWILDDATGRSLTGRSGSFPYVLHQLDPRPVLPGHWLETGRKPVPGR